MVTLPNNFCLIIMFWTHFFPLCFWRNIVTKQKTITIDFCLFITTIGQIVFTHTHIYMFIWNNFTIYTSEYAKTYKQRHKLCIYTFKKYSSCRRMSLGIFLNFFFFAKWIIKNNIPTKFKTVARLRYLREREYNIQYWFTERE